MHLNQDEEFVFEGNASQAWIFRCRSCLAHQSIESTQGRLTLAKAEKWAREAKWRKQKEGWTCESCARPKVLTDDENRNLWINEKGEVRA